MFHDDIIDGITGFGDVFGDIFDSSNEFFFGIGSSFLHVFGFIGDVTEFIVQWWWLIALIIIVFFITVVYLIIRVIS